MWVQYTVSEGMQDKTMKNWQSSGEKQSNEH